MSARWLLLIALVGLIYIGAIVFTGLFTVPQRSDLAVVLGNEVLADGTPSGRLRARLDCAIKLYRQHLAPLILVSGGVGKSGYNEATVMAEYLRGQGIAKNDILIDSEGINTMATAINTAALAHAKHFNRILIVSQYYHIPRCLLAFHKAGLLQISADYPRYFEAWDIFAILREGVAIPAYFAKKPDKN